MTETLPISIRGSIVLMSSIRASVSNLLLGEK